MPETWYRGEAIDVAPATPGSTPPHDIGDGMYLTDSEASARAYAELRTTNPAKRRIFAVEIDPARMRILDLTKDPRWLEHVKPVEPMLKMGTANENYGRTFESFVRVHKIDLNQFDAVIGHDYVRGGKQMSILHRGGRPSRLHATIRKLFRPLTPQTARVRSWTPRISVRARAVRVIGEGVGVVGMIAVTAILAGLEIWMTQRMIRRKVEEGLEALEPKIDERLKALRADVAKLQLRLDEGEKVFANVIVEVRYVEKSLGVGRPNYIDPEVVLKDVNITTRDIKSERTHEEYRYKTDEYTYSTEVAVYTAEDLELFGELTTEYLDYKRRLGMEPTHPVLWEEMRRLREQILQTFGKDVWYLEIEPYER